MKSLPSIAPALLEPAERGALLEVSARPPRSYWQQVGRRLARDARAVVAGAVVVLLVIATLTGPWLWPEDPARQLLGLSSRGPLPAQTALLVADGLSDAGMWPPQSEQLATVAGESLSAAMLSAPVGLKAVAANTEWVRLRWQPVAGAASYHIYRHTRAPRSRSDLGLPLGIVDARQPWYEDRLQLSTRRYYYSVVASDGVDEAAEVATLQVRPVQAIGWLEAQLQDFVPADADPAQWVDRTVELPAHPLGTDYLGRDLLSRLLHGARTSLFIGITAPLLFVTLGTLYGATAGFIGGRVDDWMMRFADFVVALPSLLFIILLRIGFGIGPGESGILPMVVALVLLSWPASARLVRGQVLQLREEPYVAAARLAGAGNFYIITRHMLPNVLAVVLVAMTFAIPSVIFTEAFLSFIGMGVTPPTPSWGSMSNDGIRVLFSHPSELLWPAACISVTVLAFNVLGDALRDALDMKERD
ncbi:MAG: ABC transporter permease [Spongiibacteraceae bacterium]|jgi:oligopeptide transport system permease protein|nr:ABC transporter permease [Spongiibacteraceae bacterium]